MKHTEKFQILQQYYPDIAFGRAANGSNPQFWIVIESNQQNSLGYIYSTKVKSSITLALEDVSILNEIINFRLGLDILMI